MSKVDPVPKGYHTITPSLTVKDAAKALEFYKQAFNAEQKDICYGPDGKSIMHAELKIGNSVIFLSDEMPMPGTVKSPQSLGGSTCTLNVYVPNVDEQFKQAIAAGGKESMPVADQFWGDRYGTLTDPFGYTWGIATHKEDLSPAEMGERAQKFFASTAQRKTA